MSRGYKNVKPCAEVMSLCIFLLLSRAALFFMQCCLWYCRTLIEIIIMNVIFFADLKLYALKSYF